MEEQVVSISAATQAQPQESQQTDPGSSIPPAYATGVDAFLTELIRKQCEMVDAVSGVAMMRGTREQPSGSAVRFESDPRFAITPKQFKRLSEMAAQVARDGKPLIDVIAATTGLLSAKPEFQVVAAPLTLAGRPQGASLCIVPVRPESEIHESLKKLALSTAAFEAFLWRQQAFVEAQAKIQLREALDLLDKSNQGHNSDEMANLFCQELQRRFGCTRVSIGLVRHHAIRIIALGGSEHLDHRSELADALEAVMEECADQDIEIRYPQPEDVDPSERRVVRAHASLSERFGPAAIASFPLRVDEGLIGVVVMERIVEDPFNDATLRLLRLISEYVGPMVWTRRMADRGVLAVSRDRAIELAETAVGPTRTGTKTFIVAALLLLLISLIVPVRDRVIADGRIMADQRREVSPPFQASLEKVFIKPGDHVSGGVTPLFELDSREAYLQLQNSLNESQRLRIQADEARAKGDLANAFMLGARLAASEADVKLYQYRIDQATVKAPIDGIVTQGDLRDSIGQMVQPSKPLLEIAQLDTITAVALVEESGISRVQPGQAGYLALTARPGEHIEFTVDRITPAADVVQQKNVYRVDLTLKDKPSWLRPGMEGQVHIYGHTTNLFTIYTRPLFDSLRFHLWW